MITTINNDQAITKGMFNSVEHFFDFMDKTFTFANNNISEQTIFYNKFHEACSKDIIDKDLKRLVYNRTITTGEIIHITRSGRLIIANLFADGVSMGLGYTKSNYGGSDFLFETTRNDNLFSANTVLQYKLNKQLSTRAEFTYYGNQSNLNLYGYNQWTGAVKLRYTYDSQ